MRTNRRIGWGGLVVWLGLGHAVGAQTAAPVPQAPAMPMNMAMPAMPVEPLGIEASRAGSGTSWLPDTSPMAGPMRMAGTWSLMFHGAAFLEAVDTTGARAARAVDSVNWFMGMAEHPAAGGTFTVRTMLSLEPLTVGRCGYPDLLQTGELCNGSLIHDAQHPHNLVMELAAVYRHALGSAVALEIYGGPAGDPALGPVAYPHRMSAMGSPEAPIAHHWLDSTHVSFGVVTGGLYGRKWKAEASAFNGREPDDRRYRIELGALDSYAGRLWWLPTSAWAVQVSAGHLTQAEALPSGAREDVSRLTASATYHRALGAGLWATTVAVGRNEEGGRSSAAFLAETTADRSTGEWFARVEVVGKTAQDLALAVVSDDTFALTKGEIGYTRWVGEGRGLRVGLGGTVGLSVLPAGLSATYGGRSPGELSVFLAVRPR
jgi:hypothetical protein